MSNSENRKGRRPKEQEKRDCIIKVRVTSYTLSVLNQLVESETKKNTARKNANRASQADVITKALMTMADEQ